MGWTEQTFMIRHLQKVSRVTVHSQKVFRFIVHTQKCSTNAGWRHSITLSLVMNPCANTDLLGIEQDTLEAGSHLTFPIIYSSFSHLSSPGLQTLLFLFPQSAGASNQCGFPANWDGLRRREATMHRKENYLKGHKQLPTIRTNPLVSAATPTTYFTCKLHLEKNHSARKTMPGTEW